MKFSQLGQLALASAVSAALVLGVVIAAPFAGWWLRAVRPYLDPSSVVVMFHLAFNVVVGIAFIGLTDTIARWVQKLLPVDRDNSLGRPHHLDPSALETPSMAISTAAAPRRPKVSSLVRTRACRCRRRSRRLWRPARFSLWR